MKRTLTFFLTLSILVSLTGCGEEATQTQSENPTQTSSQTVSSDAGKPAAVEQSASDKPAAPEVNKMNVKVYYTDDQALDLIEKEKEITWDADTSKYVGAFKALSQAPDKKVVTVWDDQPVNINFKDGLLTVNLTEGKGLETGSTEERLMILTLLKTMFQFPEVKKVQILVGGKVTETLSGHMEIDLPFTREMMADL